MKVFILEDDLNRMETFNKVLKDHRICHAETVEDAKVLFEKEQPFDLILLDHDLGGEMFVNSDLPNTGFQFTKFLAERKASVSKSQIIFHTMNRPGAEKMYYYLRDREIKGFMIPFPILLQSLQKGGTKMGS
jgi:hypothetical protein